MTLAFPGLLCVCVSALCLAVWCFTQRFCLTDVHVYLHSVMSLCCSIAWGFQEAGSLSQMGMPVHRDSYRSVPIQDLGKIFFMDFPKFSYLTLEQEAISVRPKKKNCYVALTRQNLKIGSRHSYCERVEFSNIFFKVSKWGKLRRNGQNAYISTCKCFFKPTNFSKFFAQIWHKKKKKKKKKKRDPFLSHFTVGRERANITFFMPPPRRAAGGIMFFGLSVRPSVRPSVCVRESRSRNLKKPLGVAQGCTMTRWTD